MVNYRNGLYGREKRNKGRSGPAQPAVPAGRFAREIVQFLRGIVQRSRQLNGNPLGRSINACGKSTLDKSLR
jgi:hypothetical protein